MNSKDDAASPHSTISAVGNFLVCFASIEALTFQVYGLFHPDELRRHGVEQQGFVPRVRFAQALLRGSEIKNAAEIEAMFGRAIPLAKFRNQIAHNPPYTDIFQDPNTGRLTPIGPKWIANKTGKELPITPNGIREQTERATKIYIVLARLISDAMPTANQST